jgi:hypothetical protein
MKLADQNGGEEIVMNASKLIDDLVAKLPDWRGTTFAQIRKVVRDADPEIVEEWKWRGTPVWSHNGIVCLANAFKNKVKLTFYEGASLADPDKLFNSELEGGSGVRLTTTRTIESANATWPISSGRRWRTIWPK